MSTQPVTIDTIEARAKALAASRAELAERLQVLKDELEVAKRRRIQGVKNSLDRMLGDLSELEAAVIEGKALFDKPKTRVLHGIKVGYRKQPGQIQFENETDLLTTIHRLYGEDAHQLINTKESVSKTALADLPAKDLKKLGVTLTDDTDVVTIKPADSDLDKLISALIGDTKVEDLT
jgi:hypothetical protein